MWYLSHLAKYWYLDVDRAEALSVDALMHDNMLSFYRTIGSGPLDDIRNFVQQLSMNTTHAMFANGAIRLDEIWGADIPPLSYWNVAELPGMYMGYTSFNRISN